MRPELTSQDANANMTTGRTSLVALTGALVVTGGTLATVAGGPRLPRVELTIGHLGQFLGGTDLPVTALLDTLVDVAWLVWAWTLVSLVLDLALACTELVLGGVGWVRWMRVGLDRWSMPLARRAVAGAFALELFARGLSVAHAAPLESPDQDARTAAVVIAATRPGVAVDPRDSPSVSRPDSSGAYLVRPGDTLWSIAERAYGSGTVYRRIVDANVGRPMLNGARFTARGVIQPGWSLVIPDAPRVLEVVDGHRWYTVQSGDSLSSIAAVHLGDASLWRAIFELNRGSLSIDGRALDNADVIWPGLRLRLPGMEPESVTQRGDLRSQSPETEAAPVRQPPEVHAPVADEFSAARSEPVAPLPAESTSAANGADTPLAMDSLPPLTRVVHTEPVLLDPLTLADMPDAGSAPLDGGAVQPDETGGVIPPPPIDASDSVPLLPTAGAALAVASAAAIVLAHRRRRLRRVSPGPETDVVIDGGFATANLSSGLNADPQTASDDPMTAIVRSVLAVMHEYNLSDSVSCLAVAHGRSVTTLTLATTLASQALLLDLVPVLAESLGREIDASVTADGDVSLTVRHRGKNRPLAPAMPGPLPTLIPVGVLYDRRVVAAAWERLGHVLVTSSPGQGADTILTSVLAALGARCAPSRVRFWCVGSERALASPIFQLPHVDRRIDPTHPVAVARLVDDVRARCGSSLDDATTAGQPEIVLVVPELADLDHASDELSLILNREMSCVRLIGATVSPTTLADHPLLGHFGTRFVLRTEDDETSHALLGSADAAYLGGGGRLLARLDNRAPIEMYGYQVTPDHLTRLVRITSDAFASQTMPARPDLQMRPASDAVDVRTPIVAEDADPSGSIVEQMDSERSAAPLVTGQNNDAPDVSSSTSATLRIECFGGPRVMCAGRQIWPNPKVGEAKPWELLLFVATRPSDGVAAASAAESLWPDDSVANAPQRFRQLRYRLRLALADIPDGPRRDPLFLSRKTLRLDPTVVSSDATDFLDLLQKSRSSAAADVASLLERARALYVGDLMDAPDARRYSWVDERDESGVTLREFFRKNYMSASMRLADLYASEPGGLDRARDVYRDLTELDPLDDRLWSALFRIHAERGDRPGLVREERRLRELLREYADDAGDSVDIGCAEPSRELVDEYQRALARLATADRQAVRV